MTQHDEQAGAAAPATEDGRPVVAGPATTPGLKSMYLARRNPALARGAFPERWRRHGLLAMSLPFWRHASGYYQCDVLDDPPTGEDPLTGDAWSVDYDGVGVIYLPDVAAMEALITHRDFPILLADEWGAFDRLVEDFSVLTQEQALLWRRGTAIKSFSFLRPRAGVTREEFDARWKRHIGLVMRSAGLTQRILWYAHDHPVAPEATDERSAAVRERIDIGIAGVAGIAELGFASRTDLVAYLAHPDREAVVRDLAEFVDVDRTITVATNEVTMDGRRFPPGR